MPQPDSSHQRGASKLSPSVSVSSSYALLLWLLESLRHAGKAGTVEDALLRAIYGTWLEAAASGPPIECRLCCAGMWLVSGRTH